MTKRIETKYKIDRRLGCNLWGRPKSPINKRDYRPGEQGQKPRKPSNFALQLNAKQRLKGYYGNITEKQFRRIFREASRRKGDTGANLIGLLESRLDAVVYRMKLVPTVFTARQMVNHGHILVNGKRVNIPSFCLKEGDVVELRQRMHDNPNVMEAIVSQEREVPAYVEFEAKKLKGKYLRTPTMDEVPYPVQMEPNLVVEYYSRNA